MKGILLAGGSGTRLYPLTKVISKQLLPVNDKPMIYYPLSILMIAGIREILIISTPKDLSLFEKLLGDGLNYGLKLSYEVQQKPEGIAQAFQIGKNFIGQDDVCLILGDNILFGAGLKDLLLSSIETVKNDGLAVVYGYHVDNPKDFGVIEFKEDKVISIEEKPENPKSNFAVIGLYFYPNDVVKYSYEIKPSDRGELEITSINQLYLHKNKLSVKKLGRGNVWLDTGTNENISEANILIRSIEQNSNLKIGCIEEIAFEKNWIEKRDIEVLITEMGKSDYANYLKKLITD